MSDLPDATAPRDPDLELSDEDEENTGTDGFTLGGSRRWWLLGGALVVLASLIAVWFGISATRGISWNPAAVKVVSDRQIDVTFDVTGQDNRPVRCTLVAYALDHSTVGQVDVDLPPSSYRSTRYTRSVRTVTQAVTGEATHCELR
jgi:hypothetical protein